MHEAHTLHSLKGPSDEQLNFSIIIIQIPHMLRPRIKTCAFSPLFLQKVISSPARIYIILKLALKIPTIVITYTSVASLHYNALGLNWATNEHSQAYNYTRARMT